MLGSIIGDIVGSIYEFDNIKTKDFEFFQRRMEYTDDSILTLATAQWLLQGGESWLYYYSLADANPHPMGAYGTSFVRWVHNCQRQGFAEPYNSCGNGSAMRVGPVGWAFDTETEVLAAAKASAECTHNHPEGIKGAQATALCILIARQGNASVKSLQAIRDEIRNAMQQKFGYEFPLSVDELRPRYSWKGVDRKGNGGICQDSVPQAILCALEANDFEDAIRNAISIGGDSDTIGCITGSIAEALYGIPTTLRQQALTYLPSHFQTLLNEFEQKYGHR